jgi:hypothetical protein
MVGLEVQTQLFLKTALSRESRQLHTPNSTPGKIPLVHHRIEGLIGPRAYLDTFKNIRISCLCKESNDDSSDVQHLKLATAPTTKLPLLMRIECDAPVWGTHDNEWIWKENLFHTINVYTCAHCSILHRLKAYIDTNSISMEHFSLFRECL